MFEIGGLEVLVIVIVALVVLGPEKLPHAAAKTARAIHTLRRAWINFQRRLFIETSREEQDKNADTCVSSPKEEEKGE